MKTVFGEYYKILMYTIFGLMLIMSSYMIILNIHHGKTLNNYAVVSSIDKNYVKYMDNVTKLEDEMNSFRNNNEHYLIFNRLLTILKKDGVFRLVPNKKLTYRELYSLNDYFIEELINNGWVKNIKLIDNSNKYSDEMELLINNANYLNNTFIKNGLILYDDNNSHKIIDDYNLILNNYAMFSSIILNIVTSL